MPGFFQKLLSRKRSAPIHIATEATGISLSPPPAATIIWQDVTRIVAFKRDAFTHDMICLLIQTTTGLTELNEFMPGWEELTKDISNHLPEAKPFAEWFLEVAFPAFETKPTTIFDRSPQARS